MNSELKTAQSRNLQQILDEKDELIKALRTKSEKQIRDLFNVWNKSTNPFYPNDRKLTNENVIQFAIFVSSSIVGEERIKPLNNWNGDFANDPFLD